MTDQDTSNLGFDEVQGNQRIVSINRMPILTNPRQKPWMEQLMLLLLVVKELLFPKMEKSRRKSETENQGSRDHLPKLMELSQGTLLLRIL
jgi:hypothetical protein